MDTWGIVLVIAAVVLVIVLAGLLLSGKFKADELEVGFPFLVRFTSKRASPDVAITDRRSLEITGKSQGEQIDMTDTTGGEKTVAIRDESRGKDLKL